MDNDPSLLKAKSFQDAFEGSTIRIIQNIETKRQELEGSDWHESDLRDPQLIAGEVAAQIAFFRKLKFQYLEQSAKDKYIKNIVSNTDDTPFVTSEDNRALHAQNEQRKAKLKEAKSQLVDVQSKMRELGPRIEHDYTQVKQASSQAASLSQKIIDTRLALSRLRQAHPHPRLTESAATAKLAEQDVQLQELADALASTQDEARRLKDGVKKGSADAERLRMERTEIEKRIKTELDDTRWLPLCDWLTQAISVHRSLFNLQSVETLADNELELVYKLNVGSKMRLVSIKLIFLPGTRQLATVEVSGLEGVDVDVTELIDAHVPSNDAPGVVAAILARVSESR